MRQEGGAGALSPEAAAEVRAAAFRADIQAAGDARHVAPFVQRRKRVLFGGDLEHLEVEHTSSFVLVWKRPVYFCRELVFLWYDDGVKVILTVRQSRWPVVFLCLLLLGAFLVAVADAFAGFLPLSVAQFTRPWAIPVAEVLYADFGRYLYPSVTVMWFWGLLTFGLFFTIYGVCFVYRQEHMAPFMLLLGFLALIAAYFVFRYIGAQPLPY